MQINCAQSAGENHLDLVRLSPNLPWAQQRLSLQGWILPLRVVSYIGTKTTGARSPPRAVRLPTHGSALILGASCVDRGLSLEVNVPSRQPVPASNRLSLFNWFGVLVRTARENIEVCRSECPLWANSGHPARHLQCPLWIRSGHVQRTDPCPLYSRWRKRSAPLVDVTEASSAPAQKLPKRTSRQTPPRTKRVARCREDSSRY